MANDPIQPPQTRFDWYVIVAFEYKEHFAIQEGLSFSRKWIPGHKSILHIKVSLLQRETIKKSKNRSVNGCYFRKQALKCPFMIPLQTMFA